MTSQPQAAPPQLQTWTSIAKEWFPLVGSFATVLIPVAWLMGRSYMIGYYQALGIPLVQLNLSLSDYLEAGWFPLVMSLVFSILLSASLIAYGWIIIPLYRDALLNPSRGERWMAIGILTIGLGLYWWFYTSHSWTSLGFVSVVVLLAMLAPTLFHWVTWLQQTKLVRVLTITARVLIVLIPPVLFLMLAVYLSFSSGKNAGRAVFSRTMFQMRLTTDQPLMLDTSAIATTGISGTTTISDTGILLYDDLYLLTFNDGRYFLFKTVTEACLPEKVYVVKEDQVRNVDYTFAPPPQPSCATGNTNSPVPTPLAVTPTASNQVTPTP